MPDSARRLFNSRYTTTQCTASSSDGEFGFSPGKRGSAPSRPFDPPGVSALYLIAAV